MTQAIALSFQDVVPKTSPTPMEEFPPSLWGSIVSGTILAEGVSGEGNIR